MALQPVRHQPACLHRRLARLGLPYVDAAHRVHTRVEGVTLAGKDTGPADFPSQDYGINTAWLTSAMIASTLLAG
jgi:hypothetical protein